MSTAKTPENATQPENLESTRNRAADAALEAHDFGDAAITDHGGWTRDGIYWSKRIYGEDPEGNNFCASFGVEFDGKDSTQVRDTWCENIA